MASKLRLIAVLGVVALVAAACGGDDDAGGGDATCEVDQTDGDLLLYNWSEYIDPDLLTAFAEQHGVTVSQTFYDSNESMLAQIQMGQAYDVIVPSDYMVTIMVDDGLIVELQRDAIPNLANLDPTFADPAYDPGGRYSAAYQWGTTGLAVDMDVVGEDFEPSWGLVFDPELAGQGGISMLNDPRETMGAALKYLGYSLNSTSLDELQEAADLVAAANITKFDSLQYTDDLINGEVAVSHGFSGTFFFVIDDVDGWDRYAYFVPEEGGTVWVDNMSIPTNAEHPCTAHTFINFILDAENGAALTNWNYSASPNEAAEEFIDPEILEDESIYPSEESFERLEFIVDTGDFEINYTDYFSRARN
ncbi:MAG TPA: spermidine/putrescine ABC transporter substrate-binding protein [Acidimicrobiia bacterium]|nr:spermidine/putrescine ABC transporter substrate-binding protein [Acidimicrobiia bacterium]